jgi:hypothetical protein
MSLNTPVEWPRFPKRHYVLERLDKAAHPDMLKVDAWFSAAAYIEGSLIIFTGPAHQA